MFRTTSASPEAQPRLRRFNIAEHEAMWAHGIFSENERVELVAGEIVEMPPVAPPHVGAVTFLAHVFEQRLGDAERALVFVQQPVAFAPDSMPLPDLALVRHRADFYRRAYARPEDVLLLIEIADASLRYDRGRKLAVYASAGIGECWIADLASNGVEIYRHSTGERYADARVVRGDATVAPQAFPDCGVRVKELFGLG